VGPACRATAPAEFWHMCGLLRVLQPEPGHLAPILAPAPAPACQNPYLGNARIPRYNSGTDITTLGSGKLVLPWYWRVALAEEGSADSLPSSSTDVAAEYEESKFHTSVYSFHWIPTSPLSPGIRVQWFRARERHARWREEVQWLQREAASTLLDFAHRRDMWLLKADTPEVPGWAAFCHRQSAVWETLLQAAHCKLDSLLQV
jgi:hypothetical protein